MKKSAFIYIILVGLLFPFASCNNKSNPKIGDDIPEHVAKNVYDKAPITQEGVPELEPEIEDCHGKRNVSGSLKDVDGFILKIGDTFVLTSNNGNNRYKPCEIPDPLKTDGMAVRFSGDYLEIFPNERLIATPFRIEYISERDK